MLVLQRKRDEQIVIGGCVKLTVVEVRGGSVRIGIDAPRELRVDRKEVADAIAAELPADTQTVCPCCLRVRE